MPYLPDPSMQRQHPAGVPGSIAAPVQSPNQQFLDQFWNAYQQGVVNPQLAANQGQISGLLGQQQIGSAQSGLQQQQAQQQYGFDTARLGLQQQGLGAQQNILSRQMGLLPQQNALQQQIFDIQQGQLGRGESNLYTQLQQGQREAQSSAVSRGAINTAGYQQNLRDLSQQFDTGRAQLADQQRFLGINREQNQLNFREQQAQQRDAQRQLDLQAQGLGLSGRELSARLDNALQQIGLSNALSSNQVVQEIAKIKNGEYSILSNIIPVLSQFAGLNLFAGA